MDAILKCQMSRRLTGAKRCNHGMQILLKPLIIHHSKIIEPCYWIIQFESYNVHAHNIYIYSVTGVVWFFIIQICGMLLIAKHFLVVLQ